MQDRPLLISSLFEHGRRVYADSRVITIDPKGERVSTFREVGERTARLAVALGQLGVGRGDRVATFCWNNQEHLEAYFAISGMGAVLHTLNIRLFPDQLAYVINHAEDKVIIVDDTLIPVLARVCDQLEGVEHIVVVGSGDASALDAAPRATVHRYEALLDGASSDFAWPELDERTAAAMAYTSGTTGNPKGVVYSHRSTYLHAMALCTASVAGLTERDMALPIVPMFHANAWGIPYGAWMSGTDLLMPGPLLQPQPLVAMIEKHRPTFAGAVPSIWTAVLHYCEGREVDLSSFRMVLCGGSAVPRTLMEAFESRHGVEIVQAWGMTETSPLGAVARPPRGTSGESAWTYRTKTGRVTPGVEMRIVDDDGRPLPWDGDSVGEVEVRGPWVTGSYYRVEDPGRFQDGWLRTGDVGTIDPHGYMLITDRAKDIIKTGGEWISSVDLENQLMAHPDVLEAAVIGVADEKWGERPLACIVAKPERTVEPEALRAFLGSRVARWWLPERWTFVTEVPKTSVGKFDKKRLRAMHTAGELTVTRCED